MCVAVHTFWILSDGTFIPLLGVEFCVGKTDAENLDDILQAILATDRDSMNSRHHVSIFAISFLVVQLEVKTFFNAPKKAFDVSAQADTQPHRRHINNTKLCTIQSRHKDQMKHACTHTHTHICIHFTKFMAREELKFPTRVFSDYYLDVMVQPESNPLEALQSWVSWANSGSLDQDPRTTWPISASF